MKKLIASLTILATGAALASSVSSTATFGVLKITSSAKETAISVPWISAGTSGETILVKDFVKTSNLTGVENEEDCEDADILLVYDPSTKAYKGWYLKENNGNKVWTGLGISYNGISAAAGDDSDTLTRGQALILIRQSTTDPAIYLYGQYKTRDKDYLISYDAEKEVVSLFAPINVTGSALDLNTGVAWDGVLSGDQIKLQGSDGSVYYLVWNGTTWVHAVLGVATKEVKGVTYNFAQLQPGMGAWYIAVAGTRTNALKATLN